MPLQTAYLALSPYLYWSLDAGNANDLSGHGFNGVAAGDFAWVTNGVETGKGALMLNPSGSVLSSQLNLTAAQDMSLSAYFSASPSMPGGVNFLPFLTLGQTGTSGRGIAAGLRSSGGPIGLGQAPPILATTFTSASFVQPVWFWHNLTVTFTQATHTVSVYPDGGAAGSSTSVGTFASFITTDPLLVAYSTQIVVAHVAVWRRVLTSTEINSIATVGLQWPYSMPTSQQIVVDAGSVDLTPVTTDTAHILANQTTYMPQVAHTNTVVDQLHSFWQNYITVTLPSLNDMLSNILGGLTATVTDVAGTTVQKLLSAIHVWDDSGAFHADGDDMLLTDCGVLDQPLHNPLLVNNGLQLHAEVVPDGFGLADGYVPTFEERLGQFLLIQQSSGTTLAPAFTEVINLHLGDFTWLFRTQQSVQVAYCIAPGVTVRAKWLFVLAD